MKNICKFASNTAKKQNLALSALNQRVPNWDIDISKQIQCVSVLPYFDIS